MTKLPPDPLDGCSIAEFGIRLRRGDITCEAATRSYLARIECLESKLNAFTHVADEQALHDARAIDGLLAGGVDLGPLMGVAVAVKDLFTVDGMPLPTVGSKLDVSDLIEPEGTFVKRLKRAGCVILGKTRMTEFAFGLVNLIHRPPWNPWDAALHRMPGGSSSGSAVALAAGLCALSVGSDTGGSVRQPAALCGVFGFKATAGVWPLDGVFPLSSTFDSIGFFAHSAEDAAVAFAALTGAALPGVHPPQGVRLGQPANHYFEGLSAEVGASV
ncbi:MAG: amidase, partial [Sulfuricaulis sp.]|nr:amidase [Sulfuricaulis sp.]